VLVQFDSVSLSDSERVGKYRDNQRIRTWRSKMHFLFGVVVEYVRLWGARSDFCRANG
jgi:hypothetical protein